MSLPFEPSQAGLASVERVDREALCMGTSLGIHLAGAPRDRLQGAANRILEEAERIEHACSTRREGGQWHTLNGAQGRAVPMDREWVDLLGTIGGWRDRTGGTFDPVVLALIRAGDADREGEAGPGSAWAQARQASGFGLLELDRAAGTARLAHPGAGLEGGGFLKGYALDAALGIARAEAVPSGWLDFGGQILGWGPDREVAIADPGDRFRTCVTLRLPGGASLSCSGCSERGRHLLDPRSGRSCPDWGAVAAVAPSGLEAEILSTALYVLGPEDGLAWAMAQDVAAAFLVHGGPVLQTPALAGLRPILVGGGRP